MSEEATTTEPVDSAEAVSEMVNERPENVPEKFWDSESNSLRTDDVLKSYSELEKRFGSFTGAPDEYAFNISEDMQGKIDELGLEVSTDDPLYEAALEMAKETGMNQEGFDRLTNLYLMSQVADVNAMSEAREEQMKLLGDRAQSRINNLNAWGEKNLSPELFEMFQNSTVSAEAVQVMEHLIAQTRNAPIADTTATPAPSVTESELMDMQFATDEFGNRKINTDPAFRAEYKRKMKELHGEGEHRIMVG